MLNCLVSFLLILFCSTCFALPDDREKVLQLSADSADLNQQTHHGEYYGKVELDQGSTHLRAASAFTTGDNQNKLILAEAKGNKKDQAHLWTLMSLDKPPLHAYADIIRYQPGKNQIELIGNARVIQGEDSFAAPKIIYDTIKQHVVSKSDGNKGTTITIHPRKIQ